MLRCFSLLPALAAVSVATLARAQPLAEDFDDNRHGWPSLGESDFSFAEIADGALRYENYGIEPNHFQFTTLQVPLDTARPFAIDLRAKHLSGTDNRIYGLTWGLDPESGARRDFGVTGDGWYMGVAYDGKDWSYPVPARASPQLVHLQDYNTLSIRKIGDTLYYLLNGQAIGSETHPRFHGSRFGVIIPSGGAAQFDSLRITYLDLRHKELITLAEDYEQAIRQHQVSLGPPTEPFLETFEDNRNAWPFLGKHESHAFAIDGGSLRAASLGEHFQYTFIEKPINPAADFEISLRFTHIDGVVNNCAGLVFGRRDFHSEQFFGVAPNGYYRASDSVSGEFRQKIDWTQSSLIDAKTNTLAVKKVGNRVFYYINGQILNAKPFHGFEGNYLGVVVAPGMSVNFESLELAYLNHSASESANLAAQLDAELRKAYLSGKVSGAYHAAAAAEQAAKEARQESEASRLDDGDRKQLEKVRRQFANKTLLQLYARWKRPAHIEGDPNDGHRVYYNYKLKGRTQYYYRFDIIYSGPKFDMKGKPLPRDKSKFAISNIALASQVW